MISISSTCFGRNYRPKHVELIEIINKLLLLHLVGCLYYFISDARSYKYQISRPVERLSIVGPFCTAHEVHAGIAFFGTKYELWESFCSAVRQSVVFTIQQKLLIAENIIVITHEGANSELLICQNAVNLVTQTQTLTLTYLYHHQLY